MIRPSASRTPVPTLAASLPHTPTKRRRKRASFSPRKKPTRPRTSDPLPQNFQPAQHQSQSSSSTPRVELLNDFTLWDDSNEKFRNVTAEELKFLYESVQEHFPDVESVSVILPWIVVTMETCVPSENERPFMIAGLVAVFLLVGEPFPLGISELGIPGDGPRLQLPPGLKGSLQPYRIPDHETFEHLFTLFPRATHISYYPRQLLVELESEPEVEFISRLSDLPTAIEGLAINYSNGPFLHTLASRLEQPDPTLGDDGYELVVDDTCYLDAENGGELRPGVRLECMGVEVDGVAIGECYSNSGIAVQKNGECRLTVAAHTWDAVKDKIVYHGGNIVGTMEQIIGGDIGLVPATVPVSNKFLENDIPARRLIPTGEANSEDYVVVDSCVTGVQKLKCAGVRYGKRRQTGPGPSANYPYIILEQGIYQSSTPIVPRPPVIRLGMCGTPFHRVGNRTDSTVKPCGDILGFFLWVDVPTYAGPRLYCYSQPTDPLINARWQVATEEDIMAAVTAASGINAEE